MSGYITGLPAASALTGSELVEVSQLSTDVRIAANSISVEAATQSLIDSEDGFLDAGFSIGDRVQISGFEEAGNNHLVAVVTAVEAGTLTFAGEEGGSFVDEAVGENVIVAKWVSRRAVYGEMLHRSGSIVVDMAEDYILSADDAGKYIRIGDAAALEITVPDDATGEFAVNAEWHFRALGDVEFAPDSGVTINPPHGGSLVLKAGMTVTLKKVAADEFDLLGQTVAA